MKYRDMGTVLVLMMIVYFFIMVHPSDNHVIEKAKVAAIVPHATMPSGVKSVYNSGSGFKSINTVDPTNNCRSQMQEAVALYGPVEEPHTYDSNNDFHDYTWWWWKKGISIEYIWGKNVDGCKLLTSTFKPIN